MKDIFIDFNVKFGLEKVWRWKWWISSAVVITGIVSFLLSSRIKPEYLSSASFIPPHLNSLTMLLFDKGEKYKGIVMGSEEDLDRAVEALTSKHLIDSVAKLYNLYDHYTIPKENRNKDKIFYNIYNGKNRISYSDKSVVTIDCYDTNPDTALLMAKTYLNVAELFYESIANREGSLLTTRNRIDSLRKVRLAILDSMSVLRDKYRIFVMNNEGDPVSAVIAEQLKNSSDFRQKYDHLRSMEFQLNGLEYTIGDLEREVILRQQNMEQIPDLVQVFQAPVLSTYKARPKRIIIVGIAMFTVIVFAIFLVLIFDRSKDRLPI